MSIVKFIHYSSNLIYMWLLGNILLIHTNIAVCMYVCMYVFLCFCVFVFVCVCVCVLYLFGKGRVSISEIHTLVWRSIFEYYLVLGELY